MTRERTYTDTGYIETQWSRGGQLVCIVSSDGNTETMHQFTDHADLTPILAGMRRAQRQAYGRGE